MAALFVAPAPGPRTADAVRAPRLLPVPIVAQATSWTCGAAALMSTLVYFGVCDEPESRLDKELGATPEQACLPQRIAAEARALKRRGGGCLAPG